MMLAPTQLPSRAAELLSIGSTIAPDAFANIRRKLVLDHCKWDPQVGDVTTLANFPLVMSQATWSGLAGDAEDLAAETVRAEEVLLHSPRLQRLIGVPWRLRKALGRTIRIGSPPAPVRVMRFDFHLARDGWHVSEVNSDVPGGFTESSSFTRLVAESFPGLEPAGNPVDVYVAALARNTAGPIVLLAAPGFMEDQQVVSYFADRLRDAGREAILADPGRLRWHNGYAYLDSLHLGGIVRFYQAEWLTALPPRCGWINMLGGGKTPVSNPGVSLLGESKRLPLAWEAMPFDVSAWRHLLPETRDPRDAPWQTDDGWLLKSAYCNTGDTVTIREHCEPRRWRSAIRAVRWRPRQWLAQRRFETLPLESPIGPVYPCIGVYVIDGRAAGAYARIARTPIIDYAAIDIALLLCGEATSE